MVDTNLLVYCFVSDEIWKQAAAVRLVQDLQRRDRLVLTPQILNEFYVSITRPTRPKALSHDAAVTAIQRLTATAAEVVPLTQETTLAALEAVPKYSMHFWDALIWAAARMQGVTTIYTEDFQHGREIEGVTFVNPLVPPAAG
jgi:predicted nucleic acid-binding protein